LLFSEIDDISKPYHLNSIYINDKDNKTPHYVAQLELIRQLLEANPNATNIGKFESGHVHGQIKEAI
jgi:hypothetical protein